VRFRQSDDPEMATYASPFTHAELHGRFLWAANLTNALKANNKWIYHTPATETI